MVGWVYVLDLAFIKFVSLQDMGMKDFAGKLIPETFCKLPQRLHSVGIVKSEKTMQKFAESAVKYLRKHKFDGLDLGKRDFCGSYWTLSLSFVSDFEYPGK